MRLLILILFWGLCADVSTQTIIDIQVDEMYLDGNNISFINRGEINEFDCELISISLRDYEHTLVLECEEDNNWQWNENPLRIEFEDIKHFDNPDQLSKWIEGKSFKKEPKSNNSKLDVFIQYFDVNLFAEVYYGNYSKEKLDWYCHKVEFWDYVYIRVNHKYLIIGLVDEEYGEIGGYIIPKENGETIVVSDNFLYYEHEHRIDRINILRSLSSTSFFRIKTVDGDGYQLYDKLFQEVIIGDTFDQIRIEENYIYCQGPNGITLYDKSGQNILEEEIVVAYDSPRSIQYLKNNKIHWLDYQGIKHDTFPNPKWELCGTIPRYERRINAQLGGFDEISMSGYSELGLKTVQNSLSFESSDSIISIRYLNDLTLHSFDAYSNLNSVFSFPENYYLMETDNAEKIIAVRDSNNLKIETKFKGEIEVFGYHHPIRFKEDGLYGYYPQNSRAKYSRLEKFNFFFAKFELSTGETGWLDTQGNEYFKE